MSKDLEPIESPDLEPLEEIDIGYAEVEQKLNELNREVYSVPPEEVDFPQVELRLNELQQKINEIDREIHSGARDVAIDKLDELHRAGYLYTDLIRILQRALDDQKATC